MYIVGMGLSIHRVVVIFVGVITIVFLGIQWVINLIIMLVVINEAVCLVHNTSHVTSHHECDVM